MIDVVCPKCRREFVASERSAGSTEECPGCMSPVKVPEIGRAAEPEYLDEIPEAKIESASGHRSKKAPDKTQSSSPGLKGFSKKCRECGSRIPHGKGICPDCGATYVAERARRTSLQGSDAFAPERAAFNYGVAGGVLMIAIAGIWFFAGLSAGIIFFYPPVLAVIGFAAVMKGLVTGNFAGVRRRVRRRVR